MSALLWRELRALVPWTILVLALVLGGHVLTVLSTAPDTLVWATSSPILERSAGSGRAFLLLIAALVFAYSGLAREYDDGTLQFLLSLPVSRWRIVASKWAAAVILIGAVVAIDELVRWWIQLPNQAWFDGRSFRVGWAGLSLLTGVLLGALLTGYSMGLSLFRRFGLVLGLLMILSLELLSQQWPSLRRLNPLDLQRLEFRGTQVLVPWGAYAAHLLASLGATALAGLVWMGATERWTAAMARWANRAWAKWAVVVSGVGLFGALGWWTSQASERAMAGYGAVPELESPEAKLVTTRYEFRYPAALRDRVERLASSSDTLHGRVAQRLGVTDGPGRVVVNMLRSSPTHAGSATWDTIRLDLVRALDDSVLLRTLVHETVHVLALHASDRRTHAHHDAFRFFDEGLAEQLSHELVPSAPSRQARHLEAALARGRLKLDFPDLIEFARFKERFGEAAVYGPALVWVEALNEACGTDAPRRVLHTLARPETPRDAGNAGLWRHVLQNIRCDLSRVNAVWGERLDRLSKEYGEELERVANVTGGAVTPQDGELSLNAALDGDPFDGAAYFALIRHATRGTVGARESPVMAHRGELYPDRSLQFELPDLYQPGDAIEFQFVMTWLRSGVEVQHAGEWKKVVR